MNNPYTRGHYYLEKNLPTILVAMLPAMLPELSALPAMLDAWPNLSHREKARLLVMVKISAMTVLSAIMLASFHLAFVNFTEGEQGGDARTSGIQMNLRLKRATIASRIQSSGCAYMASQKKRLSVGLMTFVPGSLLSKTQCDSPVVESTSFHHRRPTSRRPAIFLR